ncbi:MAG: TIGR03668 family PPOX class F420-dependent oxidoreductase [Actinomycetota bacterium]
MEPAEARTFLEDSRVATLATVRPDGRPHLVPIVFAFEGDDLVTAVDAKPKATLELVRLENITSNPQVSVLVQHYEDDWSHLWWVRVDGLAVVETAGEGFERAIAALRLRYHQYHEVAIVGPVIRIGIERMAGWRA